MKTDQLLKDLAKQTGRLDKSLNAMINDFKSLNPNGSELIEKMQSDISNMVEEMKNGNPYEIAKKYAKQWDLK